MKQETSTLFWVFLRELGKVHYFFKAAILSSPCYIILIKRTNFSKKEFMEKYTIYTI